MASPKYLLMPRVTNDGQSEVVIYRYPDKRGKFQRWKVAEDPKELLFNLGLFYDTELGGFPAGDEVLPHIKKVGKLLEWGYVD